MKGIINIFFFLISVSCYSQTSVDSQWDSIDLLLAIAERKINGNVKEAEQDLYIALEQAQAGKYIKGETKALQLLGKCYFFLNKPEDALLILEKAVTQALSVRDSINAGISYNSIGSVYLQKFNQFGTALQYYSKAHALLEEDSVNLVKVLNNIGTVHNRSGNYDEALETYSHVYKIAEKTNDLDLMSAVCNNIAAAYGRKDEHEKSIPYFKKSIALSILQQNHRSVANVNNNIALAYKALGKYELANDHVQTAINEARTHHHYDELVYALMNHSNITQLRGNIEDAIQISLEAEAIAVEYHVTAITKYLYDHLSNIHEKAGALEKALIYKNKLARFNDSIATEERKALVANNLTAPKKDLEKKSRETTLWFLLPVGILASVGFMLIAKHKLSSKEKIQIKKKPDNAIALQHLEVQNGGGLKLIDLDAIYWFQKDDNGYFAYTENSHYKIKQNMSELETLLPSDKFFRINRAVIINMQKMNNYSFWENHKYIIRMQGRQNGEFTITRVRLREMKEKFSLLD